MTVIMNYTEELKKNEEIFLAFLREKYHMYYNSNIFLRDVQYGIKSYFRKDNIELPYSVYEKTAVEFLAYLTAAGKLIQIDKNVWKVNFQPQNNVKEDKVVQAVSKVEEEK